MSVIHQPAIGVGAFAFPLVPLPDGFSRDTGEDIQSHHEVSILLLQNDDLSF